MVVVVVVVVVLGRGDGDGADGMTAVGNSLVADSDEAEMVNNRFINNFF